MTEKEEKLCQLLNLKYETAQSKVLKARHRLAEIEAQIAEVASRRNLPPDDPADQLYYERHIGWLDRKQRELSISAAQAHAQLGYAKDALRVEFGRKTAMSKAIKAREASQKTRADP